MYISICVFFHKHLDIRQAITAEGSPLHKASIQT